MNNRTVSMRARATKFLSYYRPYLNIFIPVLLGACAVAATTVVFPLLVRYVTKDVLAGVGPGTVTDILKVGAAMLALTLVQMVASMFVSYRGHMIGTLMEGDMRAELFDHYQGLSFGFFDGQKTGQLMTRLTNDLFSLTELYHHAPEDILISLVKFVGAFVVLIHINAQLTLLLFALLPFLVLYALYFNKRINVAMRRARDRIGDINARIEDNLSGIKVVKSFANEDLERQKFARDNSRFIDARRYFYRNETYYYEGVAAFTQFMTAAVVFLGAFRIVHATLDLADLLTFLLYVGNLIDPINRLVNFTRLYQEGITGFDRFMEMLEVEPEIRDAADAVDPGRAAGNVTFDNVGFRYSDSQAHVLKGICLDVKAGQYVALVGSSGVGKTTLCSLIPRFYEVTEGRVLLDGRDVRDIRQRALRRNIGIVQQDVYLFAGTVAENIRYGKPDASREEIEAAAVKANAHEFIMDLPDGYDTDIGQRGVKLSGGQKQRLSIARVFLKDPPILIFDEATSALDYESERVIQESLEALAQDRTTFVIAHRLSTIRNAQKTIVLTGRGIDEQGTHDELMALNGTYARLYNMQFDIG